MEALIYAAYIRLAVCRVAMSTLRSRILAGAKAQSKPALEPALTVAVDDRTRPKQFLLAWNRLAVLLLPDVLRAAGIRWESNVLEFTLAKAVVDSMPHRDTLSSHLVGA